MDTAAVLLVRGPPMDRLQRIHALHRLLKDRTTALSRRAIEDHLECSRATVRRIIDEMRDLLGAPIVYDRAAGGYRYDPAAPAFELPGLWFNPSELLALLASLELLAAVQPGLFARDIGQTARRIRALLAASGFPAPAMTQAVRIQPLRGRLADPAVFETLLAGILRGRQLELAYRRLGEAAARLRRVHPWRLLRYRDAWYLVAWCPAAQDTRRFALDRIANAALTAEAALPPDAELLERLLTESFGIFHGLPTATARLAFTDQAAHLAAAEVWHPQQHGRWDGATYLLDVPYADPRELLLEVLRHIPHVRVLAPPDLAQEFTRRILAAAAMVGE